MATASVTLALLCCQDVDAGPLKKIRRRLARTVVRPSVQIASAMVPLQPFRVEPSAPRAERVVYEPTALPAEPVRLAYYTPRAERVEMPDNDSDNEREPKIASVDTRGPTVPGSRAVLRNGVAYAPSHAPDSVKRAIWAVNELRRKPYVWGGGHRSFYDYGYDCSGSVSYALHYAGALNAPLPSNELQSFGRWGRGRWFTVYARNGHTFAMIAGLRLDTTDLRHGGDVGPRWYVDGRDTRGFAARHPEGL